MTRLVLLTCFLLAVPLIVQGQDIAAYFENHRLVDGRVLPLIRQLDSATLTERQQAAAVLLGLDYWLDRLGDDALALLVKHADGNDDRGLRDDLQKLVRGIRSRTQGDEVRRLVGHTNHIAGLAFSPDGTRLASAGWDRCVRVWDVKTGAQLFRLEHDNIVHSVTFSPDGKLLASTGKEVCLWDAATGKERFCFRDPKWTSGAHYDVCFSADSTRLLTCPNDGVLRSWDVTTGQVVRKWKVGQAFPLRLSADGSRAYVGASDQIGCWDLTSGERSWVTDYLAGGNGTSNYRSLALTPDGATVVAGNQDGILRVLDAKTGRLLRTREKNAPPAQYVALSAKGDRLLIGGGPGPLRLLTYPGLEDVHTWKVPANGAGGEAIALSPDGRWAAAAGADEIIRLFRVPGR